jgi:hypothetical protein
LLNPNLESSFRLSKGMQTRGLTQKQLLVKNLIEESKQGGKNNSFARRESSSISA